MTLVELGIVIIIVGIILSLGAASWVSYAGARKIVLTAGEMRRAKNCLIQRILNDRVYPNFSSGSFGSPLTASVDECLEDKRDGWGRHLCYLQGLAGVGDPLDDTNCLLINETGCTQAQIDAGTPCIDPCDPLYQPTDPTAPAGHNYVPPVKPYTTSRIVDDDGNLVSDVAFVIVSMGADGVPDHTSYSGLFPGMTGIYEGEGTTFTAPWAAVLDGTNPPDFSDATTPPASLGNPDDEDLYMVVTFSELLAELAKARQ